MLADEVGVTKVTMYERIRGMVARGYLSANRPTCRSGYVVTPLGLGFLAEADMREGVWDAS